MLTGRLADGLGNLGVACSSAGCARRTSCASAFPRAWRPSWPERLAAENVYAAPRLGRLRISPHVYNDEADVDRFVEVFRKVAI